MRHLATAVAAIAAVVAVSGCSFTGLDSQPLPFAQGSNDFVVTVEMANSVNLVPNSEVKVDDITVGAVRRITFRDWHAVLQVALNKDVHLPRNAVARIGQKSLLGAEYLEIAPPASGAVSSPLRNGDTIALARTGRYPETEEVLSALSLLLNGGGLDQIRTISTELNNALSGRTQDYRSVLARLDTFIGSLDQQRGDIVQAMVSLDRFANRVAKESDDLARAIDTIPAGLAVLNAQRKQLVRTLRDVSDFGQTAVRLVSRSQTDVLANLKALQPVLTRLADAGTDLPESVGIAMLPLPTDRMNNLVRGDYINLYITADLSAQTLSRDFLTGGPLDGVLQGILGPEGGKDVLPMPEFGGTPSLPTKPQPPSGNPTPSPPATKGLAALLGLLTGGAGR